MKLSKEELKKTIVCQKCMVIMDQKGRISRSDLPEYLTGPGSSPAGTKSYREAKEEVLNAFEQKYFPDLIRSHRGNVLQASKSAHIDRKYLISKLKKHGIDPAEYKARKTLRTKKDQAPPEG